MKILKKTFLTEYVFGIVDHEFADIIEKFLTKDGGFKIAGVKWWVKMFKMIKIRFLLVMVFSRVLRITYHEFADRIEKFFK